MNDFTKDELEEILMWADFWSGSNPELIKKIQSMIDNYCTQHTWIGCPDGIMFCYHCKVNKNDV